MGEPLDRDVVTRVLRRASELADDGARPVDGIDEEALVEAADEVGIPVDAVRRAIAVERLGPAPSGRLGDVVLGRSIVVVDAELPGPARAAMARLDASLVAGHHLRRERRREGRAEWAKRTGIVGTSIRTVRSALGDRRLGRVSRVAATVRDTGAGSCVVRIEADRSADRRTIAGEGAAVTALGFVVVLVGAVAAAPAMLLAAPVAVLAGVGVASRGRGRASRIEHDVQLVLEAVDQGDRPGRLGAGAMRRAVGR